LPRLKNQISKRRVLVNFPEDANFSLMQLVQQVRLTFVPQNLKPLPKTLPHTPILPTDAASSDFQLRP
jgi:hypothetical protein